MIEEASVSANIRNDVLAVGGESGSGIRACSGLANVVWRGGCDDDFCALGYDGFGGVGEVCDVGLNDDAGGCGTGLGAGTDAVATTVISGR